MFTQWCSHGANRGHAPLKFKKHMKKIRLQYIQVLHITLMASHKRFAASDEHRTITHTRGPARTCVFAQRLKRFITRNFSSQLNRILKMELVQNRNRFRRIRYSEMDIPTPKRVWIRPTHSISIACGSAVKM